VLRLFDGRTQRRVRRTVISRAAVVVSIKTISVRTLIDRHLPLTAAAAVAAAA